MPQVPENLQAVNSVRRWDRVNGGALEALHPPEPVRYSADWDPWCSSTVP